MDGSKDRRTEFFERVYDMVEQVPEGMVATYGQIASLIGEPRKARYVGYALHANPRPGIVPCHRIVFADGRLAPGFAFGGPEAQRDLLDGEGVAFLSDGRVDLSSCRWPAGLA
ncbi:MAG: MGMT family protein [Collinsella sp.]|nr:MGMT family protein [Collinsella sp.]